MSTPSINLSFFEVIGNDSSVTRGTLINPTEAGLWETCSFIYYLSDQLKTELAICRTLCPEP